ncbi:MAG: hypothetical protein K940chlam8_00394 [Chlamydiae bacterium]|nr:hypothetical protein [Chlamydiota bacterium]
MRYLVTDDHIVHFRKEGLIEFEGLELQPLVDLVKKEPFHFNLSIHNPEIQKAIFKLKLPQIASQLCKQSPVQFVFDCILKTGAYSLKNNASCSQLQCAAVINLENLKLTFIYYDFEILIAEPVFLIGFAKFPARYIFNDEDPYKHALKEFGFSYSDVIHYASTRE